jgi:hypothetical protein
MDEVELRALVRGAIARQAGRVSVPGAPARFEEAPWHTHASHGLLPMVRGGDGDGACLIEPSVRCNHCGYCLSYGH